jgi:hypothetical protein
MEFIFDNFQIVIIVAGAIAYFLNNLRQAKEAERQAREEQPVEYEDVFGPDFDFGEAVDHRRPAVPPPLVVTSRPPPPLPPEPAMRIVSANERELQRQQQLQERLSDLRRARSEGREDARATRVRVAAKSRPGAVVAVSTSLRSRLRNKGELRRAIVLREILGPPVAFK